MNRVCALIAEDEPLLAESLRAMLLSQWPELDILKSAGNGNDAVDLALKETPDVIFLDIRMPGKTGLEAAAEILDGWPADKNAPLVTFVTAYNEFAIEAFEHAAVDFVLKPVVPERLVRTTTRLRARLAERHAVAEGDAARVLRSVQGLSLDPAEPAAAAAPLDILQVGLGDVIQMVALDQVIYFEAVDKYVKVVTAEGEGLIRISMRQLLARTPPQQFMQIHRSFVVNRRAIRSAKRDDIGHTTLTLRESPQVLPVSRAFAHLFRPM